MKSTKKRIKLKVEERDSDLEDIPLQTNVADPLRLVLR